MRRCCFTIFAKVRPDEESPRVTEGSVAAEESFWREMKSVWSTSRTLAWWRRHVSISVWSSFVSLLWKSWRRVGWASDSKRRGGFERSAWGLFQPILRWGRKEWMFEVVRTCS